jgi:hypothetical protein
VPWILLSYLWEVSELDDEFWNVSDALEEGESAVLLSNGYKQHIAKTTNGVQYQIVDDYTHKKGKKSTGTTYNMPNVERTHHPIDFTQSNANYAKQYKSAKKSRAPYKKPSLDSIDEEVAPTNLVAKKEVRRSNSPVFQTIKTQVPQQNQYAAQNMPMPDAEYLTAPPVEPDDEVIFMNAAEEDALLNQSYTSSIPNRGVPSTLPAKNASNKKAYQQVIRDPSTVGAAKATAAVALMQAVASDASTDASDSPKSSAPTMTKASATKNKWANMKSKIPTKKGELDMPAAPADAPADTKVIENAPANDNVAEILESPSYPDNYDNYAMPSVPDF